MNFNTKCIGYLKRCVHIASTKSNENLETWNEGVTKGIGLNSLEYIQQGSVPLERNILEMSTSQKEIE